ncbi:ArsR/SmtB family transcription factor [Thalassobacillus pellis]|uniref:ArsR/SmtB family transcription factor n=1 Tax=Thalassobacillus pellis TaxID=748008 RepID=UPI0019604D21|nr:metalloregulator ArsR/SmtB family transcription factor [Thalassobacillus pellis]MBM7554159.1 biotin operon repressor [Thalassobacillus pellis]
MEIFSATSRPRETYKVELEYSLLWECALGIAAITNTALLKSLEKEKEYWKGIKQSLSAETRKELEYVRERNTWKALLQLLHERNFKSLDEYLSYIENLSEEKLRFICIPFLGDNHQQTRQRAANGEGEAVLALQKITKENPFFPEYISFISKADIHELKQHLITIMASWYDSVIRPEEERISDILDRDHMIKGRMAEKMSSQAFVEWATGGIQYPPEPGVYQVILIPHIIYRPWNVEADIEGTKVFYYPVSNDSLHPDRRDIPDMLLVQKHKALGDEVRLRILKLLCKKDHTLQGLTNELGMGKTTVHHHLKMLKSARLVVNEKSIYRVKQHALTSMAQELDIYLEGM